MIRDRRSIRAYLDCAVSRTDIAELLELARCAPSGANLQPGHFHVLTGSALEALSGRLLSEIDAGRAQVSEYDYFPEPMPIELKSRQRAAGYALYEALGIERRDIAGRKGQFLRNYRFFDAPVGIVVTIDRAMGRGCWMDLGMAIQTFLLAVEQRGLGACGIGALANYADVVHEHLGLDETQLVVCGIALGYPDLEHPVNQFRTDRADLDEFATFYGF